MSQKAGHSEVGVQGRHAAVDERSVLFGGVGMSQSMEGNAPARYGRVTDGVTVAEDKLLHAIDSPVGGDAIRHQQLVAALRFLQQPLQHHRDTVVLDGDDTHLAALALYGEGVLTQCLFRRSGVHAEALVDTQTGVAGQIQGKDVVLPLLRHGAADQLAELRVRPCTILLSEAAAFQGDTQFFIARQRVAGMGHLIVEKADGGKVGFDGAGGLALLLQIENVAYQMLAADVLQLLQMVAGGEVGAETLDRLVVAILRAKAALSVVASQLVQLGNEGVVNAFCGHIKKLLVIAVVFRWTHFTRWQGGPFPAYFRKTVRLPQAESLGIACFSRLACVPVSLYLCWVSTLPHGAICPAPMERWRTPCR